MDSSSRRDDPSGRVWDGFGQVSPPEPKAREITYLSPGSGWIPAGASHRGNRRATRRVGGAGARSRRPRSTTLDHTSDRPFSWPTQPGCTVAVGTPYTSDSG